MKSFAARRAHSLGHADSSVPAECRRPHSAAIGGFGEDRSVPERLVSTAAQIHAG